MRRYGKRFFSMLLASVVLMTSSLPAAAAPGISGKGLAQRFHTGVSSAPFDIFGLPEKALEFLAKYSANKDVKSAFGKTVESYNTEALKDTIWNAIFMNREYNVINFEAIGISQENADVLIEEVLAESNAEEAVAYSVSKDSDGDATVMEVQIDPMYEAAYDEIDAATANTTSAEVAAANTDDGIMVLAEDDDTATDSKEQTMKDAYAAFNEYQQFIDDNPDYFGITVPYTSVKDDSNEGGGPITSLVTIANSKMTVDMDGDGTEETETTLLEMFKAGYLPASDLIQIINMFHLGNQLAVNMLGTELIATKDEALAVLPSDVSAEQKLLILNDWLTDKATFDMASIMELDAPEPTTPEIYTQVVGALQQQGLGESDAQALAQQLMGLWGGNQFGVLTKSMGNKGVCMSYTYAYAYLVQWAFSDIYKNEDGSWKTRLELNYIPNPKKETTEEIALMAEEAVDETDAHEHTYQAKFKWSGEGTETSAKADIQCTECEATAEGAYFGEVEAKVTAESVGATCASAGKTVYTATVEHETGIYTDEKEVINENEPATGKHTYGETATWSWVDNDTATALVKCTQCGTTKEETVEATETSTTPSTCTEAGKTVYTATVTIDEKEYTNTNEVALELAEHTYSEETDKCTVCGELRPDHEHTYGDPVWSDWTEENTTTATFTCTVCNEEETPENVNVSNVVTLPTCTEAGYTTYTASVEFGGESYTNPTTHKVDGDAATGHTYTEAPVWAWADDNTATATYTCATCKEEYAVKAEVTSETTATCTEVGTTTYTATVTVREEADTDTKTVDTAALGHKFDENGKCTVCGEKDLPDYVWDPSAAAMVDYVRITYDTEVTMYGESQGNFDSVHYWNAVKVDGQWYYVDPCYTDIFVECMIRDRVETDGNMSHLYFMFSDTSARSLYEGNFSGIDTLYADYAKETKYEDAWFAFAKSPIYKSGSKYYYFYDSTDMISLTTDSFNSYNQDTEYKLVYHDGTKADTDASFQTLIDFVEGEVRVVDEDGKASMKENELIATLYAEHEAYQEKYPSIGISCDMEGNRLYFNISNCILYYDVETCEVVKVFEYNEVTAERDLSMGLGGMAFTVVDPTEEAEEETEDAELTTLTVENNPIASMTIKNGNMYVSVGTTIGFISGKESMSEEDTSIGYQFEETNYNPEYMEYVMSEGAMGEEEENDNDEFMWSANFVDVIEMSHITGEHTYEEVYIEATCGKNAYTENRCTECGAIEAGTREEIEDTALEHHFVKFDETYYTKTGDAWNTGTCYVCTICKDDRDELEDGDHVGHEKKGFVTEWGENHKTAVMAVGCEPCYRVNYDCLLGDEYVVLAEGLKAEVDATSEIVKDEETEKDRAILVYTASTEYEDVEYKDVLRISSKGPFPDVTEIDFFFDPVVWAVKEENNITTGYPNGYFGSMDSCTRAQAVTFLYRAYKGEVPSDAENTFPDVKEDEFYTDAVLWAVKNGITEGYPNGDFGTDDTCTRAQIVTFLYRAAGKPEVKTKGNTFSDVKEGEFYYDAVLWAEENGITEGYPDGNFGVNDECTRGQIVTFLYRALAEKDAAN